MGDLGRESLLRLIREEIGDRESQAERHEKRARDVVVIQGPDHSWYPLSLVRAQYYTALAAADRDFARRLRDLLTEMGETL